MWLYAVFCNSFNQLRTIYIEAHIGFDNNASINEGYS